MVKIKYYIHVITRICGANYRVILFKFIEIPAQGRYDKHLRVFYPSQKHFVFLTLPQGESSFLTFAEVPIINYQK
ncbi:MAG: hypothetical protein COV35_02765 [Alphaproteobacteria bacterium CG11_big_fil_rev_8_21_14_0_20_39_49]|nr:MAG: hypothetical protein COV35_02765 [Alphaproteobacteria bacterium CG11_big_fil_rev_8_21_14_0_20_39_49]